MSVLDALSKQATRLAGDVQSSLRRARLEGERRLLQRQHRTALEDLGERTFNLSRSGELTASALAPEIAAVEGKLMEIDAKQAEIDSTKGPEDAVADGDPTTTAFPMVETNDEPPTRTGWEAADRFFRP